MFQYFVRHGVLPDLEEKKGTLARIRNFGNPDEMSAVITTLFSRNPNPKSDGWSFRSATNAAVEANAVNGLQVLVQRGAKLKRSLEDTFVALRDGPQVVPTLKLLVAQGVGLGKVKASGHTIWHKSGTGECALSGPVSRRNGRAEHQLTVRGWAHAAHMGCRALQRGHGAVISRQATFKIRRDHVPYRSPALGNLPRKNPGPFRAKLRTRNVPKASGAPFSTMPSETPAPRRSKKYSTRFGYPRCARCVCVDL